MKILMLTPYLPYPDSSGGQIRTQNLLKHLGKKHQITLISLIKNESENQNIKHLLKYCHKVLTFKRSTNPWTIKNILKTGFSLNPFLIVRNFAPGVREAVAKELKTGDYDLIHAETFYVMPSIPDTKIPIVLVDQTIEYLVYQHYVNETAPWILRPLLQIDVEKTKYWERYYWRKASIVVSVSEADRAEVHKLEPNLKVDIVRNGVNLDLFRKKTAWHNKEKIIMQLSNFRWLQNVEAAEMLIKKVYPLVKSKIKNVKVWIVGQHIPLKISEIATSGVIIKDFPQEDSQSLVDCLKNSSVFASTIKGPGGSRLKNLAAMASQLPIVSTRVGVEGLDVKDKIHVLIGNSPKRIANLIVKVLNSPKLAERLAKNTRKHVEEKFDWKIVANDLDQIYKKYDQKSK